jgi:hypothetical protein
MRISLDRDDPGFQGGDLLRARIFLDGIEQRHVVTADEEQGIIVRFYLGIHCGPMRQPATGELMLETVKGVVRIEWPSTYPS